MFKYGDRIQCKVINWNLGYIEIDVVPHGTDVMQINMQDVEREAWYEKAENMFLEYEFKAKNIGLDGLDYWN